MIGSNKAARTALCSVIATAVGEAIRDQGVPLNYVLFLCEAPDEPWPQINYLCSSNRETLASLKAFLARRAKGGSNDEMD